MQVHWNLEDRDRWEALADQNLAGLQQSWAYGQALQQLGVPCLRAVVTRESSAEAAWVGAAQFIVQRLPWFVRFAFTLGGPLWAEGLSVPEQREALAGLRRTLPLRRPRLAFFTPALNAYPTPPSDHPYSGRLRVATGGSTVLLDLSQGLELLRAAQEGRWRNRLAAAERSALKVRVCGSKPSDYRWLVQAEATQRQERRYFALPTGFVEAFQAAHRKPSMAVLTLAAEVEKQPCAGMMFLLHGRSATYHLGWSSETGRELNAHNLLLWEGCRQLIERGVARLDLGGVNTVKTPGLARFKMGSGGQVVTWAGTWL